MQAPILLLAPEPGVAQPQLPQPSIPAGLPLTQQALAPMHYATSSTPELLNPVLTTASPLKKAMQDEATRRNRVAAGFMALAVGWDGEDEELNAENRELALQAFGAEFVEALQNERDKETLLGKKLLAELYARQGDIDETDAAIRYERMTGSKGAHGAAFIWKDASARLRKGYGDLATKRAAINAGREAANAELNKRLSELVVERKGTPAEVYALLDPNDPDMEGAKSALQGRLTRAQNAAAYLEDLMRGALSREEWEAKVETRTQEIMKKGSVGGWRGGHLTGGLVPVSREAARTQAETELQVDASTLSPESMETLTAMLTDESGELDKVALRAVRDAMLDYAEKHQTTDGRFVRNFMLGLADALKVYDEKLKRHAPSGRHYVGGDVGMGVSSAVMQANAQGWGYEPEPVFHEPSPNERAVRAALQEVASVQRKPSEDAPTGVQFLAPLGTIFGQNAPGILVGAATSGAGYLASSAGMFSTYLPVFFEQKLNQNYLNDVPSAELDAWLYAAPQAAAEIMFGLVGRVPLVSKVLDWAAAGVLKRTALGGAIAYVQGQAGLRFLTSVVGEGTGELLIENVVGDTGYYLGVEGAQLLGANINGVAWQPFSNSLREVIDEPYQAAATIAYCAALGLGGISVHNAAAAEFARAYSANKDHLLNIGLTNATASKLSASATNGAISNEEFNAAAKEAFLKEVINGDPVKVRDRFKKRHQLLMDDAEAMVMARSGVMQAAFAEHGMEIEKTEDGKFAVTVADSSAKEPGTKKRVVMTEEQFAAYGQVYIERMREVAMKDSHDALQKGSSLGDAMVEVLREIHSEARTEGAAGKINTAGKLIKTFSVSRINDPVIVELLKANGGITYSVLKAMGEAARAFESEGRQLIEGVANSTVMNLSRDFEARLQTGIAKGEISEAERLAYMRGDRLVGAARLDNEAGGSTILYHGKTSMTGLVEDYIEGILHGALQARGGVKSKEGHEFLQTITNGLAQVRESVRKATGKDIMPGFDPNTRDLGVLTEYFSHFAQSRYYIMNRANPKAGAEAAVSKFVDAALMNASVHDVMKAAYSAWAETEEGKAFEADKGTLGALLHNAGVMVENLYADSKVTAEALAETMKERGALYGLGARELNAKAKAEEKARHEAAKPKPAEVTETVDPSITPEDIQELASEEAALQPPVNDTPSSGNELEKKLLRREAGVQDVAVFCRETPELTYQQAEERGLVPRDRDGNMQATWVMGATIAEHAPEPLFAAYAAGDKTQLQTYKLADSMSTGEFAVKVAEDAGLMPDGKLEAANGTLYTLGSSSFAIRARHASPHHGIRKFLLEFIGTGAGSQVYGHGLYFTTRPSIHKGYVSAFSKEQYFTDSDVAKGMPWIARNVIDSELSSARVTGVAYGDLEYAASFIYEYVGYQRETLQKTGMIGKSESYAKDLREAIDYLAALKLEDMQRIVAEWLWPKPATPAAEYEVVLNFDRYDKRLLPWFMPLSEEQEKMIQANHELWDALMENESVKELGLRGDTVCEGLAAILGSPSKARQALVALGFKGVEVLDGDSQNEYRIGNSEDEFDIDGTETYNYVVFDEADVKIVRVKDELTGYKWKNYVDPTASFAIRAKHASPTHGIRKFKLKYGGAGEGTQPYGRGMYFTTSEEEHEMYTLLLGDDENGKPAAEYEVELNFELNDPRVLKWDEELPDATLKLLAEIPDMPTRKGLTGEDVWNNLAEDAAGFTPDEIREILLNAGIRGVTYRDHLMGANDEYVPADNFVVFDENDVKLVRYKDSTSNYKWQDYTDAGATFHIQAHTRDGALLAPNTFVTKTDGSVDWLWLPARDGLPEMPVCLLIGEDQGIHRGYGLTHIAASRELDKLWDKESPKELLERLLDGAEKIWIKGAKEILVKTSKPSGWVTLEIKASEGFHSIVSARPSHRGNLPKEKDGYRLIAERVLAINSGAEPSAFKLVTSSKSAAGATNALGGDTRKLPQVNKKVNIKEVFLDFGDGRTLNATSHFSLATGRSLGKVSPRVQYMQNMIKAVEAAGGRWQALFASSEYSMQAPGFGRMAAQQMGGIMGLALKVYHELPRSKRKPMADLLRRAAVYARMVEDGKILTYGQVSAEERARLSDAVLDELAETWGETLDASGADIEYSEEVERGSKGSTMKPTLTRGEVQRLWKEAAAEAARNVGAAEIGKVYTELAEAAAEQMKAYLKEDALAAIDKVLERFTPKKDKKSGKLKRGIAHADTYREVEELGKKVNDTEENREANMERLIALLQALEAKGELSEAEVAERERLEAELADWTTFGAVRYRGWEAARTASAMLLNRAVLGIETWNAQEAYKKAKMEALIANFLHLNGSPDENKAAAQKRQYHAASFKGSTEGLGMLTTQLMSFAQLMDSLSTIPGLENIAGDTVRQLTDAHLALGERRNDLDRAMRQFLEEELGLDTEAKRAEFMVRLQAVEQTKIKPEQEMRHYSAKLSREWAAEWLAMSKEERRAYEATWRTAAAPDPNRKPIPDYALNALHEAHSANLAGKDNDVVSVDVYARAGDEKEKLRISRNAALNILLLCGQERYRELADNHGYTSEVLGELERFCGEDIIRFGHWMRGYLDNTGLKQVFEAREGVPFPAEDNYWPGKFDLSSKVGEEKKAPMSTAEVGASMGGKHGMLKLRTHHNLTFDLTIGATHAFLGNLAQTDNYICMGALTSKWRSLLANDSFARGLRQRIGEAQFAALKEGLNMLDGQGIAEAAGQRAVSGLLARLQAVHAPMVLAWNLGTLVMQLAALMHAASVPGVNPLTLPAHLLKARAGLGRMKVGEMMRTRAFAVRVNARGQEAWQKMIAMGEDVKWSKLVAFCQSGMDMMERVDTAANAVSMTALYNIEWERRAQEARDAGVELDEAATHVACMELVEQTLDMASQPQLQSQKALIQAAGAGTWGRLTFYMGSEALNKIGLVIRNKRKAGGGLKGFKAGFKVLSTMSMATQLLCMALDVLRGRGADDDEDWETWLALNLAVGLSGLGLLNAAPLLGDWLSGAGELVGIKSLPTGTMADMLGIDFASAGVRAFKRATDEKRRAKAVAGDYYVDLSNILRYSSFLGAFGGAGSTSQWVTSGTSLIQSASAAMNLGRIPAELDRNATKTAKKRRKHEDEDSFFHGIDPRNFMDELYGR